jgi:hypothetical protein
MQYEKESFLHQAKNVQDPNQVVAKNPFEVNANPDIILEDLFKERGLQRILSKQW